MMDYEDNIAVSPRRWVDGFDWGGVRYEVEAEARAEIVLLGMGAAGKSTLYDCLRGIAPVAPAPRLGAPDATIEEPLGLFTLIDLPTQVDEDPLLWEHLERATLLVYLLDGAAETSDTLTRQNVVPPHDFRWITRLQALGHPLMVAWSKADLWDGHLEEALAAAEYRLGVSVMPVSAYAPEAMHLNFLSRMVELCPRLAVPLGREIATFRRILAQRMILRTTLVCGLVSIAPVPLLDLPVQLGAQVGLVARVAAMYGQLPSSDYCKEFVLAGAGSMALRVLAQQAVKAVPILGWLVSGLLGAMTAWVIGQTALAYFDGQVTPQRARELVGHVWRNVIGARIRCWLGVFPRAWARCKLQITHGKWRTLFRRKSHETAA
ncbi:MAG TPA: hypothetical protein PKV20_02465 [Anaerolineae bacterium]|nr:hypothetical protein [Anaerolineae bacterium]